MTRLIAALSLALFAGTAFAQTAPSFEQADADSSGSLSLEEAKVALPTLDEAAIVAGDANNIGGIDADEYALLVGS